MSIIWQSGSPEQEPYRLDLSLCLFCETNKVGTKITNSLNYKTNRGEEIGNCWFHADCLLDWKCIKCDRGFLFDPNIQSASMWKNGIRYHIMMHQVCIPTGILDGPLVLVQ